jgi:serine protease
MNLKESAWVVVVGLAGCFSLSAAEVREILGRQYVKAAGEWIYRDATGLNLRVQPDVITVKFRQGVTRGAAETLHRSLGGLQLRRAQTGFVDVKIAAGQDVFDAIDAYLTSGLVEIAEPNTFGVYTVIPDDTQYADQWYLPMIAAEEAWESSRGHPNVIVAILDSGTDWTHEDLGLGEDPYQNIWLNHDEDVWSDPNDPTTGNGIDEDNNGYPDDWKGYHFGNDDNDSSGSYFHGTAVAGIVGAKTHNRTGIAGVAGGWRSPGARLMIVGVGNSSPNGAVVDDAILYAGKNGARVVQMSLIVGQTAALEAALEMAHDDFNVTLICASGNSGLAVVGYPSSDPHVIAVGATDSADLRASFSNHGSDIEISAPGIGILGTDLNNSYAYSSGTSVAAPLVSGVVALMRSVNPNLTNTEIRQILHRSADQVGGYDYSWNPARPDHSFELGYGRVNAKAAVTLAALAVRPYIFIDGFESGDTTAWSSASP